MEHILIIEVFLSKLNLLSLSDSDKVANSDKILINLINLIKSQKNPIPARTREPKPKTKHQPHSRGNTLKIGEGVRVVAGSVPGDWPGGECAVGKGRVEL